MEKSGRAMLVIFVTMVVVLTLATTNGSVSGLKRRYR